ncbi:ABC transporter permease [Paramaledivibacter caminithermalis]|jgi:ABC-2 type transport system permease protein|uniref:ABC-2 family transporter protein n=1 Tax=Paramaledivibacter caminithermalis (strain DSM 15212 / CIP 107654 / DViRD3) TaxID=1121301 RepID=A0A1M6SBE4_PARC5|nr:ABC transporter permease [Paramaledivibacter caminithermalis]SHK42025.1 ABC-2 family transporter protein [Paramaledivibacter caminithermalis DSM 15212]
MKYLPIEMKKIFKSIESKISYVFVFVIVLSIMLGFKFQSKQHISSIDMVFITLGNFSRYIMLHLVMILMTSLIVAGEFNQGTYRYIMLRPVSIKNLIFNKYIALWLFAGMILLITAALSFFVGIILFEHGQLHGEGFTILSRPIIRFIIFYVGTWINAVFIISFTTFFSVILKHNINTIVITFSVLFIILFFTRFVSDEVLDWTPINYFTLKPYIFTEIIKWRDIFFGIFVTLVYSGIFTGLSYVKLKMEDIL